jgi:hypothetical protein
MELFGFARGWIVSIERLADVVDPVELAIIWMPQRPFPDGTSDGGDDLYHA